MGTRQAGKLHWSLYGPSLTDSVAAQQRGLLCPGALHKAPPPHNLTVVPRQGNTAQMKEQSKTSERELSDEEIANLSDGEFRALVIKMLTD